MANATSNNVIRIDTDNYTNSGPLKIKSIKFMAGTTASAAIKADASASGMTLWESSPADNAEVFEDVCMVCSSGIHVDIAGTGSVLYIYLA